MLICFWLNPAAPTHILKTYFKLAPAALDETYFNFFFFIQGYSLILHHNKCVQMLHPSPSNSTRELTCSGLQRLKLAVFMNTPGTYRLFLIKDIKQGELPEPQSTCFRHFHYTCLQLCSKSLQRMETPVVLPLELL